jgi:hypothetical protein
MGALDAGAWSEAFPWLVETGKSSRLRVLLAEAERAHRESARMMRSLGKVDLARRAERFAARARFDLDEPEAARGLYSLGRDLREARGPGPLLGRALEAALSVSGADRGNIQILSPVTGSLRIAAHYGFGAEFLEYFAQVDDRGSACGRAARERAQIIIADVDLDPGFAPHRDIAAASGFRAVQSTPLVDLSGRMVGVVSTHYGRPFRPSDRDLRILNRIGELVGEAVTSRRAATPGTGDRDWPLPAGRGTLPWPAPGSADGDGRGMAI